MIEIDRLWRGSLIRALSELIADQLPGGLI